MITSNEINSLFYRQLSEWELARSNYKTLDKVETKIVGFDDFNIQVQYNPERIRSTSAKVDNLSIQERECFLCSGNLPEEQDGLLIGNEYQVLVNPFPIFPRHFTIPACNHTEQLILNRYGDMLDLAKNLDEYTIFYNGPKSGASVPDHMHFQAGNKGFLPIETDIENHFLTELIYRDSYINVYCFKDYLRNGFLIESKDKDIAVEFFEYLYSLFELNEDDREPKMNILTWYSRDRWFSCVFPRTKHRPECFYEEGEEQLLISPASVDFGGVVIVPRKDDFDKITKDTISTIFEETSTSDGKMMEIVDVIRGSY